MPSYLISRIKPATITHVTPSGQRITLSAGVFVNRRALGF